MTDVAVVTDAGTALIRAATEVFAEKGYDGAGVAEIARRAGLTTGAIYSRFSGKAELLAEAIRTFTSDEFDDLFAEHAFEGRVTDILATVGSHLVTRPPAPGQAILLEAFVGARRDPEVAAALRDHLADRAGRLGELVDSSKQSGLIDPELDTASLVHFAHAIGLGFLLYEAVGTANPEPRDWDHVISRVLTSLTVPTDSTTHPTTDPTTDPPGPEPAHP